MVAADRIELAKQLARRSQSGLPGRPAVVGDLARGGAVIYLDNNATTAIDPRVVDAMDKVYRDGPCNPSSLHALGQQARVRVDRALDTIGDCLGTRFDLSGGPRLIITSGGTESNNLALLGMGGPGPVVVSRIEHPSVIAVVESLVAAGRQIRWVDADENGVVQLQNLEATNRLGTRPGLLGIDHVGQQRNWRDPADWSGGGDLSALCGPPARGCDTNDRQAADQP